METSDMTKVYHFSFDASSRLGYYAGNTWKTIEGIDAINRFEFDFSNSIFRNGHSDYYFTCSAEIISCILELQHDAVEQYKEYGRNCIAFDRLEQRLELGDKVVINASKHSHALEVGIVIGFESNSLVKVLILTGEYKGFFGTFADARNLVYITTNI